MDCAVGERRVDRRTAASALAGAHATLRPGCPVALIDISPAGAQVESDRPLRPGSRVHVRVATLRWTVAAPAIVLRCIVWALHPELGVKYRGALQFEERCDAIGDG